MGRLRNIFQDNKNSLAVYLENQFTNTRLDTFPNVSSYCQELKILADQLSNVGSPVSNQRLVLQLIAGLNENYDGVATFIQQSDPLPPLYEARSKLVMEETCKAQQSTAAANAAATTLLSSAATSEEAKSSNTNNNSRGQGRGSSNYRGNPANHGRGRSRGGSPPQQGRGGNFQQQQWPQYPPWG